MREIQLPFAREILSGLRTWDRLLLSGRMLVGRDQVHRLLAQLLAEGKPLPADLRDQTIYYMGPAAIGPHLPIGSCGPTTAMRMDGFTPALMQAGLAASIGKGPRSAEVALACKRYGGAYLVAYGGCGALYAEKVTAQQVIAWEDLGPEALVALTVRDFPVVVGIDCTGASIFP